MRSNCRETAQQSGVCQVLVGVSTVSDFGTYITTVALSVLILVTMDGTALDQGLVNAARWAPYLLFGLLAGIWVDRFRRRLVLVAGDLGRGLILVAVCVFGALDLLSLPALMALIFVFGTLALMSDAAYQSFLPQLVPRPLLIRANARPQQSDTVAQTTGAAIAGALVALVTAPFTLLFNGVSYLFSATVLLSLNQAPGTNGLAKPHLVYRLGAGLCRNRSRPWNYPVVPVGRTLGHGQDRARRGTTPIGCRGTDSHRPPSGWRQATGSRPGTPTVRRLLGRHRALGGRSDHAGVRRRASGFEVQDRPGGRAAADGG